MNQAKLPRLLVLSFAALIVVGAIALMLPFGMASEAGALKPVEALFTATSAVCVTGLIVRDTATEFTFIGQLIILVLIQLGGLGILTLSNFFLLSRRSRIGLGAREMIAETHGGLAHIEPQHLLRRIVVYTFASEAVGALILTIRFAFDYPFGQALWLGIFHSVSAFCNAGFSLFSNSLEGYRDDFVVNVAVMALIVLGGLGFIVFADLSYWVRQRRKRRVKLSLHTRAVLRATTILVVGGWGILAILEMRNPGSGNSIWEWFQSSLFLSVTARTAGFNTVAMSDLANPTLLVLMILMIIGASPGSTGGGLKTTTAAILTSIISSRSRNRPKVEILDRSIPAELVAKALAVTAGYIAAIVVATILLQSAEYGLRPHAEVRGQFLEHLFEVVSAMGTVGLSLGVTAKLSSLGKLIIIACMFIGRLGPLMIAISLVGRRKRLNYTMPEENLMVG
ncbi:TrkH family potassium uptake protein [bacterium]|nr:TrkH family potassium uptake protein [bacterium]